MKRALILFVILVVLIAGCVPQAPTEPQEPAQPSETTGQETLTESKPEVKAAKNATAFIQAMTEDLDCSRESEMQELLEETKNKIEDNDVRLIDAQDDLKEVQASGNAANTAVKKKAVGIVRKNEVVLKDRIAKLEALIARC